MDPRRISTQRIAVVLLALLALAGIATTCAQERSQAPWPSDVFNAKPQQHVAGKFDYYTLVMSWSPTHCSNAEVGRDEQQCSRFDGLRYGFVLHGLWPQYEKGYPAACRTARKPFVPQPVINSMLDIMPSGGLIIHEYKLHGTCSGLEPADYYGLARRLFSRVRIPDRFNNPFETQFMAPQEVEGEFLRANPWMSPEMIVVGCSGPGNRLRDVRVCLTRDGQGRACGDNENPRKLCRANQMHVPPVRSTRRDGVAKKENPLQPKRDRGLPRPRVLEAPAPF